MMSSTMGRAGNYVFSPLGGVGPSTAKRNFSNDSAGDDELEAYGLSPEKKSSGQRNLPASAGQSVVNSSYSVPVNKSVNKIMTSQPNPHDLLSISFDDADNPSQPSAGMRHVHEDVDCDIVTPRGVIKASPRASAEGILYEEGSTSVKLTYSKNKTKEKDSFSPQKQSFGNQATVVYNQRSTVKSPAPTIDREKEELLAALEVLKMQNQLLTSKIEKTQIESLNQIEKERNAKRALQAQLELENHKLKDQLMQAKLSAEEQLAREKDEFLAKLAQMESEKASLQVKMQQIEDQSIMDGNILRMQRSEMLDSIQKLEEERIQLHKKLSDNEDVAAQLSEEHSSQSAAQMELQRQRDELSKLLDKLEKDKAVLAASLQDTESKARENEKQLQQKLEEEQAALNASLATMESEKQALLQKLISSEKEAEAHSEAMNKMLSEEQKKTQSALEELEQREKQLAAAQSIVSPAVTPKASEAAAAAAVAASATTVTASSGSGKGFSSVDKKSAMASEMERIKEEREELQSKLAANLNNKHQTELVSQLHNKLQLKKSVLRMKEELLQERTKQQQQQQQQEVVLPELSFERFQKSEVVTAAAPTAKVEITTTTTAISKDDALDHPATLQSVTTPVKAPAPAAPTASLSQIFAITPTSSNRSLATTNSANTHNASNRVLISPKKSLYDVLENSNAATLTSGMYDILSTGSSATEGIAMHPRAANSYSKIHLTRRSQQFHQVEKIDEVDEKTFMDWDSDEEKDDNGRRSTKSGKLNPTSEAVTTAEAGAAPKTVEELEADLIASLPSPHAAAAMGNMKKLEALCNLDTSLLKSLDSGGRKPLFYAAAYGRTEAVKFLIHLFPELVGDCDIHFDTALHAATSSGNAEIAELLIIGAGGTKEAAEPRNSLEMTPAHLASTSECLDVLYRYEADICAMDSHLRSPLFVACAMNRVDCTEYLVNCLDSTTTGLGVLLAKDKRGDTPLHAAACNGSEDCLLLLLQYGIDPRMINDIGLKAIDLAIRNNHMKCKSILAEYYLHYCTSSEFDSVLFLATLEGHRMISEMHSPAKHSDVAGSYQIIKKNSIQSLQALTSPEGSPMKSLHGDRKLDPFAQSMFSLRAVKSLRLERWGAWIAYHDQQSQTVFWYNHESNVGQWNKPEQVTLMQIGSREKKDYFDKTLQAKSSMRLTKVGDWIKYVTESGKIFYYNIATNDFQWDDPTGTGHSRSGSDKIAGGTDKSHSDKNSADNSSRSDKEITEEGEGGGANNSTNPWRPYLDEESDTVFWYNAVTQVSQWECPFDNPTAEVGSSLSPSFENDDKYGPNSKRRTSTSSFDENDGDHVVFLVNHENDLDL